MFKQEQGEDKPVLLTLLMRSEVQADLPTRTLYLLHCHTSADSPASSSLENKEDRA